MALRGDFDAKRFWDQAFRIGISKKLSEEDAEDFASLWLETVWKYQHYTPAAWIWSHWFKRDHKNDSKTISLNAPLRGSEDFTLEDLLESPHQEVEELEELSIVDEFFERMRRLPSRHLVRKMIKIHPLQTIEFRQMVEDLEPISMNRIEL